MDLVSLLALLLLSALTFAFWWTFSSTNSHSNSRKLVTLADGSLIPEEPWKFPLGFIPFKKIILPIAVERRERFKKWGAYFSTYATAGSTVFIFTPSLISELHSKTEEHFFRKFNGYLQLFMGTSILGSSGENWKRQQRILQKAFISGNIVHFVPDMINIVVSKFPTIEQHIQNKTPMKLETFLPEITLEVITTTAFASDLKDTKEIGQLFRQVSSHLSNVLWKFDLYRKARFIPQVDQGWKTLERLDEISMKILQERKAKLSSGLSKTKYLIDLLISSQDEESKTFLTEEEVKDNARAFLIAGTNTTGHNLTWLFHHLLSNPQVYEKLQTEIDSVVPSDLSTLTIKEINQLTYLTQVIHETLRITPSVNSAPTRNLVQEVKVGDLECKKNAKLAIDIFLTHHNPELWPEPEKFDPERWAKKFAQNTTTTTEPEQEEVSTEEREKKKREQYSFVAFGAGRRTCTGKYFALLEVKVIVAVLLKKFKIVTPPNEVFPREMELNSPGLIPRGGLPVLWETR